MVSNMVLNMVLFGLIHMVPDIIHRDHSHHCLGKARLEFMLPDSLTRITLEAVSTKEFA